MTFFHLFKYYVSEEQIDFHYKTKKRFVRRFIYNEVGGIIRRKDYSYIDPISLSLYVPEFYETVNEIFEGDNVNLPVFSKVDVLENEDVSLYLDDDKIDKQSRKRKASKDMIVWNIINPHIHTRKNEKNILINERFRKTLCEFIDK